MDAYGQERRHRHALTCVAGVVVGFSGDTARAMEHLRMAYVCSKVSFRLSLLGSLQSYDSGRYRGTRDR